VEIGRLPGVDAPQFPRRRGSLALAGAGVALTFVAMSGVGASAQERSVVAAAECDTSNLLAGRSPSSQVQISGDTARLTDGEVALEGDVWDAPTAVKLANQAASITYDLGQPRRVGAFYLQGDANDTYSITGSADGRPESFRALAVAAKLAARGPGLHGRAIQIAPVIVRYLRVGGAVGDGFYSVSELAAYCRAPTPFPPAMRPALDAPSSAASFPPALDAPSSTAPKPPATLEPAASGKPPTDWLEIVLAAGLVLLIGSGALFRRRKRMPQASRTADERSFPVVLALFVASGSAALIYEIVWLQMLQLVLGSSAVSVGVLLGTFMGGMCLGSLTLSRFVSRDRHPLRVYAVLEIAIGTCGLLMLVVLPLVQAVYTALVGNGIPGLLLRGLFAAICLLPPTAMMGATLPAVSRWVEMSPRGVSRLGYLYGGNALGAIFGCLLAGFYLLRVFGMRTATFVAVGLNAAVAAGALWLLRIHPEARPSAASDDVEPAAFPSRTTPVWVIYLAIGLSGMSALGAEVIWTRLLGLLLSQTTYTFSIILAVFLLGIGLGSGAGSAVARRTLHPQRALGAAQLALIAAIAWTSWNITSALPGWPVDPRLAASPWFQFQIDFVRCLWAILPAACLWGASFPLALAAVATRGSDGARVVGRVYAANTVGGIVGALGTSLVLIAALGTQDGERALIAVSALAAALTLLPLFDRGGPRFTVRNATWAAGIAIVGAIFALHVAAVPPLLVGHGRFAAVERKTQETFLFVGEGMSSSPAVSRDLNGTLSYYNAGKIQASSLPQDMRLQRMLGHLTTLIPERPRDVLVIACGAGVTAGAASIDPRVEHLSIAEIEPLVPRFVAPLFGEYNDHVVGNPKVHVALDDARHFLTTTKQKFDGITSDPFDPWVKGAANLYTREFWELAKRHLNPGGVVTVFVQLYDSGMAAVKSQVATFFEAFPNGTVWGNAVEGQGYDVVLLGQVEATRINVDLLEGLLQTPEMAPVARSLREVGFDSAGSLLSTYSGRGAELAPWLEDAEINRDDNLRLQFLAGFGMNVDQRKEIYRGMLALRHYPGDLFTGSPARLEVLRIALSAQE
jgi:spermidine synthase